MEMRDLRSFVVLAEQLHFGRAAKLLHVSQPALTKQIRRVEEDLNGSLFHRGRHGTRLSSLGTAVLQDARAALREFDQLVANGRQAASGERGRLRIGFGFHTFDLVPRLVVELRKRSAAIQITLQDLSTAEQTQALRAGQIDIGFVRLPVEKEFQSFQVTTDRLALVSGVASGIPAKATLRNCRDQSFVLISEKRAPGYHRHVLLLCARHGFHPQIIQEVPEVTTALALVRAGLGIAIIPESFWKGHFAGLRLHHLAEPEAQWPVGAAWRRDDTNPILHRFLEMLRRKIA
jgi:DNA-binding transcriptional LysR family regulator